MSDREELDFVLQKLLPVAVDVFQRDSELMLHACVFLGQDPETAYHLYYDLIDMGYVGKELPPCLVNEYADGSCVFFLTRREHAGEIGNPIIGVTI